MSTTLTLEQDSGSNVSYTLTNIVYVSRAHLSAHFKDASGRWWAYDGIADASRPSLDLVTKDTQLTNLKGQVMHILLYRLSPTNPTIITSST